MTRSKGSVFRMKGSANWWIAFYVGGQRIRESSHSTDYAVADELLAKRLLEVAQGKPTEEIIATAQKTVGQLLDELLNHYKINKRPWHDGAKRKADLHLRPFFGSRKAVAVNTALIDAFRAYRQQKGAADSEINRELSVLRRAYNLYSFPTKPEFNMVAEDNARQGFFDDALINGLLVYLQPNIQPVIRFAYITGWRIHSEILPLEWHMVDWQAGIIRLPASMSKNRKARTFPITGEVREILDAARAKTDRVQRERGIIIPFVFHRDGEQIKSIRGAWKSACKQAGCVGMIPHDLRRSAARNLDRAGVSQSVAMKLMGHETPSMYERYNISSEEDKVEAVQKLEQARRKA